jgi:uncharacterized damage-inducible protein DinB
MNYQTINEIYEANKKIREKLKQTVFDLNEEALNYRLNEEGWKIKEIVEHLSIVENGIAKLIVRLLEKSKESAIENKGNAHISENGLKALHLLRDREKRKVQAPERVLPSGNLSIAESFATMDENAKILESIREDLEKFDTKDAKFPHPFFGDLNTTEWLALIGGHENRHINQIEEILELQK